MDTICIYNKGIKLRTGDVTENPVSGKEVITMYEDNQFGGNGQVNGNTTAYGANVTPNGTSNNIPINQAMEQPNGVYGQVPSNNMGQPANGNYATYQSQSNVYQQPTNVLSDDHRAKKEQRAKNHFMRKALACAGFGLFFGMCTGLGFYGVYQASGMAKQIKENTVAYENRATNTISTTTETNTKEQNSLKAEEGSDKAKLNVSYSTTDSDITGVVNNVMPAMVSIVNHSTTIESFFGQRYEAESEASGSGIVVAENDEELLIVTNHHVAANATTLDITFIDGSTAEAKAKGYDADMDIAVLAVLKSDLSEETRNSIAIASLGDSDSLKLGEPVIAIGNALGYGQSVTNGIVSALNREVEMEDGSVGTFVQTNAAINPGNSGGALLNMNGEVIGINSNKIGGTAIEGMGYAIPINVARPIIDELMQRKTMRNEVNVEERGYLGITPQEITSDIAQRYKLPTGVLVYSLEPEEAAAKAGIKEEDIITKFDGSRISGYNDLQEMLKYYSAGDEVEITVMRKSDDGYKEFTYNVTLGQRPEKNQR